MDITHYHGYDILEIAYLANTAKEKEKKIELLCKLIAKLKVIDFLLNLCLALKIISVTA